MVKPGEFFSDFLEFGRLPTGGFNLEKSISALASGGVVISARILKFARSPKGVKPLQGYIHTRHLDRINPRKFFLVSPESGRLPKGGCNLARYISILESGGR